MPHSLYILALVSLLACSKDRPTPIAPAGKAASVQAIPSAPQNLRVEALTDTSARVAWDAAEGATDYDINYRPQGGRWTNWPHRASPLYSTIHGLEPNTAYRWAIRAENRDGPSRWVFGDNFTTLATAPTVEAEPPVIAPVEPVVEDSVETDPFDIDLVYVGDLREKLFYEDVKKIEYALERVESVLAGLPDYYGGGQWMDCGGERMKSAGYVDDIVIYLAELKNAAPSISGWASAGARRDRGDGFRLTTGGCVHISTRLKNEELAMVVAHEIFHALGFGSVFYSEPKYGGVLNTLIRMDDFPNMEPAYFIGSKALAVYHEAGGIGDIPLGIAHWKSGPITNNALMTPHGSWSIPFAITGLDVAALADMGYPVRMENADPLDWRDMARGKAIAEKPHWCGVCRLDSH